MALHSYTLEMTPTWASRCWLLMMGTSLELRQVRSLSYRSYQHKCLPARCRAYCRYRHHRVMVKTRKALSTNNHCFTLSLLLILPQHHLPLLMWQNYKMPSTISDFELDPRNSPPQSLAREATEFLNRINNLEPEKGNPPSSSHITRIPAMANM